MVGISFCYSLCSRGGAPPPPEELCTKYVGGVGAAGYERGAPPACIFLIGFVGTREGGCGKG